MKTWVNADILELNFSKTEHRIFGNKWDGGYIGDGIISGHLEWGCNNPTPTPIPTPKPEENLS